MSTCINLHTKEIEELTKSLNLRSPQITAAYIHQWRVDKYGSYMAKENIFDFPTAQELELTKQSALAINSNNTGSIDKIYFQKDDKGNFIHNEDQIVIYRQLKELYKSTPIRLVYSTREELRYFGVDENQNYYILPNNSNLNIRLLYNNNDNNFTYQLNDLNKALLEGAFKGILVNNLSDLGVSCESKDMNLKILKGLSDSLSRKDKIFYNMIMNGYKQSKSNLSLYKYFEDLLFNKILVNKSLNEEELKIKEAYNKYLNNNIKENGISKIPYFESENDTLGVTSPSISNEIAFYNEDAENWKYNAYDDIKNRQEECIKNIAQLFKETVDKLVVMYAGKMNNAELLNSEETKKALFKVISPLDVFLIIKEDLYNDIQKLENILQDKTVSLTPEKIEQYKKQIYYSLLTLRHYKVLVNRSLPFIEDYCSIKLNESISTQQDLLDFSDIDLSDTNAEKENDNIEAENEPKLSDNNIFTVSLLQNLNKSLANRVREIISTIPKLKYNNKTHKYEESLDVFGNAIYLDKRSTMSLLYNELTPNLFSIEDLIPVLKNITKQYKSLETLVQILENDKQAQALFYKNFNKAKVQHLISEIKEDGIITYNSNVYSGESFLKVLVNKLKQSIPVNEVNSIYNSDGTIIQNNLKEALETNDFLYKNLYNLIIKNYIPGKIGIAVPIEKYINYFKADDDFKKKLEKYGDKPETDIRRVLFDIIILNESYTDTETNSTRYYLDDLLDNLNSIGININKEQLIVYLQDTIGKNTATLYNNLNIEEERQENPETNKESIYINSSAANLLSNIMVILNTCTADNNNDYYNFINKENPKTKERHLNNSINNIQQYLGQVATKETLQTTIRDGKINNTIINTNKLDNMVQIISSSNIDENNQTPLDQLIEKEFRPFNWFTNNKGELLKNSLIEILQHNKKDRENFKHSIVLSSNNKDYEHLHKKDYLATAINLFFKEVFDMDPGKYIINRDYVGDDTKKSIVYSEYIIPTLADVASLETLKMRAYLGIGDLTEDPNSDRFEEEQTVLFNSDLFDGLRNLVWQEYNRILETENIENNYLANKAKGYSFLKDYNSTFNEKGEVVKLGNARKFNFFPQLNNKFTINDETLNSEDFKTTLTNLLQEDKTGLKANEFINNSIKEILDEEVNKTLQALTETDLYNPNTQTFSKEIKIKDLGQLRDYVYNNFWGTSQIIQLFTTDLAYYPNIDAFYKRWKEVHSPTNKFSFPKGSTQKSITIRDEEMPSLSYNEIKQAIENNNTLNKDEKSIILNTFKNINHTDAQSLRSISSYQKILVAAGLIVEKDDTWQALEDLKKHNFNYKDFYKVFQVLKPFGYTQVDLNGRKVPQQFKNSEALLLLSRLAIEAYYSNSKNNKISKAAGRLMAIEDVMEDKGIDLVLFDSANKVANHDIIDLCQNTPMDMTFDTYEKTKEYLENAIKPLPGSNKEYSSAVLETEWADTGISMETPEELFDFKINQGTQAMKLITSNISDNIVIALEDKILKGNTEVQNEFNKLMNSNIQEKYQQIQKLFNNPKQLELELKKQLQRQNSNNRYINMACNMIMDEEGIYRPYISFNDDAIKFQISGLFNTIIKNKLLTNKIAGGLVIQMSAFGLGNDINVRYKNKDGVLLFTEKEWNAIDTGDKENDINPDYLNQLKELKTKYNSYNKYKNSNDYKISALAYWECAMPIYSEALYKYYNEDGSFNIKDLPNELRYMVGYRIPTEQKHSMAPLYIKRVLPTQMGSTIIFPYEVTGFTGSNFAIDKFFLQRHEFTMDKNGIPHKINNDLSIAGRNNKINDLMFNILTNEDTFTQMMYPSNYESLKKVALVQDILSREYNNDLLSAIEKIVPSSSLKLNSPNREIHNYLNSLDNKTLSNIISLLDTNESPCTVLTNQKYQRRNMDGKIVVAISANFNASLNYIQNSALKTKATIKVVTQPEGNKAPNVRNYSSLNTITSKNKSGITSFISNRIMEVLVAAVDTAKDPLLDRLNINEFTASTYLTMMMLGIDPQVAAALLTNKGVKDLTELYFNNDRNFNKERFLKILKEKYNIRKKFISTFDSNPIQKELKEKGTKTIILDYDNITEANTMIEGNKYIKTKEDQNNANYNAAKAFVDLYEIARELNQVILMLKAEQRHYSGENTITDRVAKMLNIIQYLNKIKNNNSLLENVINEQDPSKSLLQYPSEEVAITDSINKNYMHYSYESIKALSKYYPQYASDDYISLIEDVNQYINNNKNKFNSQIINFVDSQFMKYNKSLLPLFSHKEREFILNEFPQIYSDFLDKFKTNAEIINNPFLNAINCTINADKKVTELFLPNISRLTPEEKFNYMNAWGAACMSTNTDIKTMGILLYVYNYFKYSNTPKFDYQSFEDFIPLNLLYAIKGFAENERNVENTCKDKDLLNNFKIQIFNNSIDYKQGSITQEDLDNMEDENFIMTASKSGKLNDYLLISTDNALSDNSRIDVYKIDEENSSENNKRYTNDNVYVKQVPSSGLIDFLKSHSITNITKDISNYIIYKHYEKQELENAKGYDASIESTIEDLTGVSFNLNDNNDNINNLENNNIDLTSLKKRISVDVKTKSMFNIQSVLLTEDLNNVKNIKNYKNVNNADINYCK